MGLPFAQYSGNGNDFLLFDARSNCFPHSPSLLSALCREKGCDGVILLEKGKKSPFAMRIFNDDGSEASMCGNGLLSLLSWLKRRHLFEGRGEIETQYASLPVSVEGEFFFIQLGPPSSVEWEIRLEWKGCPLSLDRLNTGVPHLVWERESVEEKTWQEIAPFLRNHPRWEAEGSNVTLCQIAGERKVLFRTYERGVERETRACGTGAVAAALSLAHRHQIPSPIHVENRSGGVWRVGFLRKGERFIDATLTGSATLLSEGVLPLEEIACL